MYKSENKTLNLKERVDQKGTYIVIYMIVITDMIYSSSFVVSPSILKAIRRHIYIFK